VKSVARKLWSGVRWCIVPQSQGILRIVVLNFCTEWSNGKTLDCSRRYNPHPEQFRLYNKNHYST